MTDNHPEASRSNLRKRAHPNQTTRRAYDEEIRRKLIILAAERTSSKKPKKVTVYGKQKRVKGDRLTLNYIHSTGEPREREPRESRRKSQLTNLWCGYDKGSRKTVWMFIFLGSD